MNRGAWQAIVHGVTRVRPDLATKPHTHTHTHTYTHIWASLVAQLVKNPPAMQDTWVQSLGWENPLKEKATHSSILAWGIPWTV